MQPPDGLGTVIVTGGASGLGAATARAVRDAGGTAVVLDRNEPEDGFERELVDLAFPREAEQAVANVLDRHDDVRGVVTAAAIDVPGRLDDVAGGTGGRVLAVKLVGPAPGRRPRVPAP